MENQKNEREISIAFLFKVLKKAIVFMIVAALFFGTVGIAYSVAVEKPKYQETISFWVANNSPGADYTSQSLVYAAAAIASSCIELVKQDMPIRQAVIKHNLTEKLGYLQPEHRRPAPLDLRRPADRHAQGMLHGKRRLA